MLDDSQKGFPSTSTKEIMANTAHVNLFNDHQVTLHNGTTLECNMCVAVEFPDFYQSNSCKELKEWYETKGDEFLKTITAQLTDFVSIADKAWLYHYDPTTKQQSLQ